MMHIVKFLTWLLLFACHVALAEEASITISSPAEGAKLSRTQQIVINYEVIPGSKGDHIHLYVDGEKAGALRQFKGSHSLEPLAPGKHEICLDIANKGHTQIGVSRCVKVSVE